MLQRIQLLLDYETKKELNKEAAREKRSVSAVAREILKKSLEKKKAASRDGGAAFLLDLARKSVSGPGDDQYDKYAYEQQAA